MDKLQNILRWIALPFAAVIGSVVGANLFTWPVRLLLNDYVGDVVISIGIGILLVVIAATVAPTHKRVVASVTAWILLVASALVILSVFIVNYSLRESIGVILLVLATAIPGYITAKSVEDY